MPAQPADRLGQFGHRVVRVHHRAVAGRAARGQPQPGHPLLRGLQQVEALAAEGQAEAADLADRLGDALEQLRVLVHQEAGAPGAAGLLVGGEGEHDVAGRLALLAQALADDRQHHRVHVLHVDRAAAPDAVVGDLAGEGVVLPVFGVGRDDVEVTVDEQGGPGPVLAFDAGRPRWCAWDATPGPWARGRPRRAWRRRTRRPGARRGRSGRPGWRCRS